MAHTDGNEGSMRSLGASGSRDGCSTSLAVGLHFHLREGYGGQVIQNDKASVSTLAKVPTLRAGVRVGKPADRDPR